ncbi:MAG TPA: protease SohB, partial [Pseudomonadales bacterium]|nr:protease SohB [Pseudomonadales bacterium]
MEFIAEYGLFLAKTVTILLAVLAVVVVIMGLSQRGRRTDKGHIEVRSLNDVMDDITRTLKQAIL